MGSKNRKTSQQTKILLQKKSKEHHLYLTNA
jgi:hypothetical protein